MFNGLDKRPNHQARVADANPDLFFFLEQSRSQPNHFVHHEFAACRKLGRRWRDWTSICSAMALRIPFTGSVAFTRFPSIISPDSSLRTGPESSAGFCRALSTSSLRIRPPGPVPVMPPTSRLWRAASFRANGEIFLFFSAFGSTPFPAGIGSIRLMGGWEPHPLVAARPVQPGFPR